MSGLLVSQRPDHAIGEDEVARHDRHAVAPPSLGANVVRERERTLRRVVDLRDEPRAPGVVGTGLERAEHNLLGDERRERARRDAFLLQKHVEARRLPKPSLAPCVPKTSVPPSRGACAPEPPAPETARSETASAAASAPARATSSPRSRDGIEWSREDVPKRRAMREHERNLVERDHGNVDCEPPVDALQDERPLAGVEDAVGLIEIARHEPLAVAREVLHASAAVDIFASDSVLGDEPREEGSVEDAARQDSTEERRCEVRHDLHACLAELRLDELQHPCALRRAGGGRHPKREPRAAADVDAVCAGPAACPLEQPSSDVRPVAEAAPGRPVAAARVEQDGAVARPVARIEPSQKLPGDTHAVDPVRQGTTDELASCPAKGWMPPCFDAEREMVPARRRSRENPDPRDPLQVWNDAEVAVEDDVRRAGPE